MLTKGISAKHEITDAFGRHVSSGKVEFFQVTGIDFIIGKREGVRIWDIAGKELINCHSNGGVFNLGHRNPRIIKALESALMEADIGNHHLVSKAKAELGKRLAGACPGDLNRVIFGVSGGEAIDMAIKLARAHTGRGDIVSATRGYHGHTGFALSAGDLEYSEPFAPLAGGFRKTTFGDLEQLAAELTPDTAGVLLETIPATAGILIPPKGYLAGVRDLCDRTGAMMIMDEVQTGLGRCGENWGIDLFDVVPDILVTGKGLSGGIYPITATVYRDELDPFLHNNPFIHISTFGGAELGCACALEVLQILEEPGFLPHVRAMADLFKKGFMELESRYSGLLLESRQCGLMMGLKLASEICGPLMTKAGFDEGLLVIYANNDKSVLQVLPPLIIEAEDVAIVLERLDRMLDRMGELLSGAEGQP